jgi:hypothetical protein
MSLQLAFTIDGISGSGQDEHGAFTVMGQIDLGGLTCRFEKAYTATPWHRVQHAGEVVMEPAGLSGVWWIAPQSGSFHLWPTLSPHLPTGATGNTRDN